MVCSSAGSFFRRIHSLQHEAFGRRCCSHGDGQKIYRADLEKYFQSQTAGSNQPLSDEQATSLRLSILHQLIENEILIHRAEKLGLLATDDEVDRKLNEIKSPYSNEEFAQRLQERKLSLDSFKRDIRRALTADKVLHKEVTSKINITQQDITDYYNGHKAEFNLIEPRYHLAHILVTTAPEQQGGTSSNKAHNEAEARKKMQTVLTRLEAGDDFGSLAMTFSEDTSTAANGGDLGIIPQQSLQAERSGDPRGGDEAQGWSVHPGNLAGKSGDQADRGVPHRKAHCDGTCGAAGPFDPRVEQEIRSQLQDRREQLLKSAYYEVMRDQAKVRNYYAEKVLAGSFPFEIEVIQLLPEFLPR